MSQMKQVLKNTTSGMRLLDWHLSVARVTSGRRLSIEQTHRNLESGGSAGGGVGGGGCLSRRDDEQRQQQRRKGE